MKANSIIFGVVAAFGLYLAFSLGHRRGLEAAPEYVAHKVSSQTQDEENWAKWMAEYQGSQEKVCDQIFELVLDYEADTLSVEQRERGDEF